MGGTAVLWNDKSSAGRYAAAPDAASGAEWLADGAPGGHPALVFTGAARLATVDVPVSAQLTVIAAIAVGNPAAEGVVLEQSGPGALGFALRRADCSGCDGRIEWVAGSGSAAPYVTLPPWTWTVLTAVQDTTHAQIGAIGQSPAPLDRPPLSAPPAALVIGNDLEGTHAMDGAIGEIRIYGTALHRADRAFVESRIRSKYGL